MKEDKPSEDEIRTLLKRVLGRVTERLNTNDTMVSGWDWLVELDYQREWDNKKWNHRIRDEEWERLVFFARGIPSWPIRPEADAFDAACHVSARMLRDGVDLPPVIRDFVADVLAGEIKRPSVFGRPKRFPIVDLHTISFAVALKRIGWLHMGENTLTEKATARPKQLNASRAVAEALTSLGHHTSQARVKDLYYNEKYQAMRQSTEAAGWVDAAKKELQQALKELRIRRDETNV